MYPFNKFWWILMPPRKGVHSVRIFNISLADLALAFLLAWWFQVYFFPTLNFIIVLMGTFLLGIFLHRLFGVRTTVDKLLFKRFYKKKERKN
tara:strand:- start:111 stop:386 length:276 start_codon:yes stop_codon:yes gene_type:complete